MGQDRRRYPRVGVQLDCTLEASGRRWQGKTIDLSPYGVKVALPPGAVVLPPGTNVEVHLALPDREDAPLPVPATVVRTDDDGAALNFVHERAVPFARLKELVDSILKGSSGRLGVSGGGPKDRRRTPRIETELDVSFDAERPYGWRGSKAVNLSLLGAKVALPGTAIQPAWGTTVQMRLECPDGHAPVRVKGLVWRRERDSIAVLFVELGRDQLERLGALVESLRPFAPSLPSASAGRVALVG